MSIKNRSLGWVIAGLVSIGIGAAAIAAAPAGQISTGKVDLAHAGPIAFGPQGLLFVGDSKNAAVYAIHTDDAAGNTGAAVNVKGIDRKVAALLGASADQIEINDLAVNPDSGAVYLSVSRGRGPDAAPAIVRVDSAGMVKQVSLDNVRYSKAMLPNAPEDRAVKDRRGRPRNPRMESITDLMYHKGTLYIAGLSNEEFASNLRAVEYPFSSLNSGSSIEIFHGNHGKFETHSPIRAFTAYEIDNSPHLLAGYTCTPLVKIPLAELKPQAKVVGTTIAELGNRNTPLDMFVYNKGGRDYILMANDRRGVMKITTQGVGTIDPITARVGGVAGLEYQTIESLQNVAQLDRLNRDSALILVQAEGGPADLQTIPLP